MALSKKSFAFFLLGLVLLLGGGIALIVIFKNRSLEEDSSKVDSTNESQSKNNADSGEKTGGLGQRSEIECRKWTRNRNPELKFTANFIKSRIAIRKTVSARTGENIIRNAFWVTGNKNGDLESINGIRFQACMGKIPIVVIRMRPTEGFTLSHAHSNWDYYKPKSSISSWADYDAQLKKLFPALSGIPALIILEPDLLMFAYDAENPQHRWSNQKYETEFLIRAQKIIKKLPRARVYLDAGNAAYLGDSKANLDHMATTLLRVPGLRGFAINTFHFINKTYNEFVARQLYCRTGLHYLVDTSRNGGSFSKQPLPVVQKCLFDPPDIKQGQLPGWAWGSQKSIRAPRLKRWINQIGSSSNQISPNSNSLQLRQSVPTPRATSRTVTRQRSRSNNQIDRNDPNWKVNQYNNMINKQKNQKPQDNQDTTNSNNNNNRPPSQQNYLSSDALETKKSSSKSNGLRSQGVATQYLRSFKSNLRSCMARKSNVIAHDANIWMKVAGESDGRLYRFGAFRSCLIDHAIPCDDSCQMFVQLSSNSRDSACQCSATNSNFDS